MITYLHIDILRSNACNPRIILLDINHMDRPPGFAQGFLFLLILFCLYFFFLHIVHIIPLSVLQTRIQQKMTSYSHLPQIPRQTRHLRPFRRFSHEAEISSDSNSTSDVFNI